MQLTPIRLSAKKLTPMRLTSTAIGSAGMFDLSRNSRSWTTHILLTMPLLAPLAACNGDRAPVAAATDEVVAPVSSTEPDADAPAERPAQKSLFTAYGEARLGMAVADVTNAWRGVAIERGESYEDYCYYLSPEVAQPPASESPDGEPVPMRADFQLMVEEGVFVRYEVNDPNEVAPGGGKIGMTKADILRLYPGRVEEEMHQYDENAVYLRITDPAGSKWVLVFESGKADPDKVTEWRVGQEPQVDYVEGCS